MKSLLHPENIEKGDKISIGFNTKSGNHHVATVDSISIDNNIGEIEYTDSRGTKWFAYLKKVNTLFNIWSASKHLKNEE